jgi:hypothetical protein
MSLTQTEHVQAERLLTKARAIPSRVMIRLTNQKGDVVRADLRAVHEALNAADPGISIELGRDYFSQAEQWVSLRGWHQAVERHIQALESCVRELRANSSQTGGYDPTPEPPIVNVAVAAATPDVHVNVTTPKRVTKVVHRDPLTKQITSVDETYE